MRYIIVLISFLLITSAVKADGCPQDIAKNDFYHTCVGGQLALLVEYEDAKKVCRCAVENFTVTRLANPPSCEFDVFVVQDIMRDEKVTRTCR